MTTIHDDDDCPGCGSTPADREAFGQRNMGEDRNLLACPHCAAFKCCMCNMGDDVGCLACDGIEE